MRLSIFLITIFSIIILSGCYTILPEERSNGNSYISKDHIRKLDIVMNIENIAEAGIMLEKLESTSRFSDDPVIKTMRGNIDMIEGKHWAAGVQFKEAIQLIRNGKMYVSTDIISQYFIFTERRKNSARQNVRDDADIIKEFYNYLHGRGGHRQVVDKFRNRSGFVQYPPIFSNSGTPGLILELLNEQLGKDIFQPRNIQYFSPAADSLLQVIHMQAILGMNLMIASILSMDLEGIEEAVDLLRNLRLQSKYTRFYIGFGFYLLGRNNYAQYLDFQTRNLFIH